MQDHEPFAFQTERRLVMLTGRKARNLAELVNHLRTVSGSSIFYHTHHQYLAHHFEKPVFHNDFALWVSHDLLEEALAEKLASIDMLAFGSVRGLREALVATVESHMAGTGGNGRECPPGAELHFCESKSFIMPTGIVAQDIPDFFACLPMVSDASLYFHFFEARLRLERTTNDFSEWLAYRGASGLARNVDKLNPYLMTMGELKEAILAIGESGREV